MGAKNFTEELILGQLYQQALQAKGYKVSLNDSFPGVALINAALKSGKIQWYPEYTWEVITAVAGQQGKNIKTAQQAWDVANQIEKKQGFQLLPMTPIYRCQRARRAAVLRQQESPDDDRRSQARR